MLAHQRPAGVPDNLSPDELERWSNELVAYLTSDGVPANFRVWARRNADLVDAYMASAEDFGADSGGDEVEAVSSPAPAAGPAPAASTPRAKKPQQPAPRGRKAAAEPGMFVLRIPEQTARLGMGIAVGALAVLAIFGVRAVTGGSGGAASLPSAADATALPFDQARADQLQSTINQNPSDKDALFELGEMYFEAGRFEDSIASLTKVVDLDPANKSALNDIGTANFNLGRPDQAKEWWQRTLAADPNDVQAHYNMGFVYANAEPQDLAAAVTEWETVVRLDPQSQLGQTAKVHVDGLKAKLAGTPAAGQSAGQSAATPTPAASTP